MINYRHFTFFLLLILVCISFTYFSKVTATTATWGQEAQSSHVMLNFDETKWGPAPPVLPPGAQMAVLAGDPTKAGTLFTIRAKFPNGYKIPPHWHPTDENVTVIKGTFVMGLGEKFNEAAAHEIRAGGFAMMPKEVRHYAWAKGETIVQVHAIGPFEFNYVNAADDPRNKAK